MMKNKNEKDNGPSPFIVPTNAQLFSYTNWTEAKRRGEKSRLRNSTKKWPSKDTEELDICRPLAITDIDPGYFTDLAGRPIREKFSKSQYIDEIRKILKTQLAIGYKRDECLRIDLQFAEEQRRLSNIERHYRQYVTAFEQYLSDDHEASMKILDKAQQETRNSQDLIEKRDKLSKEFGQVRLEVYQWEEMWRVAKMCHEFVQKISPSKQFGREETENIDKAKDVTDEKEEKPAMALVDLGSLENLVEAFERDIREDSFGCGEISLKDPHELSRIFGTMELRNLDALIHLESLAGPMAEMTSSFNRAQELIGKEVGSIEESLEELKSLIVASEKRAIQLKAYADYLLHEVFRELVCSESVLHLRVFIEDAYESCVGPNDASRDGYSMMREIEKTYESLNMSLDNLPQEIVKRCAKEGFTQEMRTIREAEDAARKFELMHRLLAALERIMEPAESNLKAKSKLTSADVDSKIKLPSLASSSVGYKQRNNIRMKGKKTILKRPRRFFTDDCHANDIIPIAPIDIRKIDDLPRSTNASTDSQSDCRDKIE